MVGHGAHRHEEGLCEPVPSCAGGVAPRPAVRTSVLLPGPSRQPVEGDLARWPRCMPVHEAFGTGTLFVAIAGGWHGDDFVRATRLPASRNGFSRYGANYGRSGGGSMSTPMRPPPADDAPSPLPTPVS